MVTNDVLYVGVDDKDIDLFEGQFAVPNGIAYNSYVILDDKIAVMDTVDRRKRMRIWKIWKRLFAANALIIWWFPMWSRTTLPV